MLRRTHHVVRRAGTAARRLPRARARASHRHDRPASGDPGRARASGRRGGRLPRRVGEPEVPERAPLLELTPDDPDELAEESPCSSATAAQRVPAPRTARSCAARRPAPAAPPDASDQAPAPSSRRSATSASRRPSSAQISGPRVTRYELQLAPGTKVGEGRRRSRTTSPTRSRRPRSASSRRSRASRRSASRSRTSSPNLVTLGDIFDDLPPTASPLSRLARQGHLRQRRLDRPRADAAHPDRRHDRLGQVGLHQHDAHLDPAALDARTRCG